MFTPHQGQRRGEPLLTVSADAAAQLVEELDGERDPMNKLIPAVVLCCALAPMSTAFGQGMMGTTLNYTYFFPDSSSPYEAGSDHLITNAVEVTNGIGEGLTMDLTDSQFIMTFNLVSSFTGASFNGPVWADTTNNLPAITSVTIDPSTNWPGFDASRVVWDGDSFGVNMQGLNIDPSYVIVLNVAAPTPGAAAALGLGGLAGLRRRRR
jgi:MYXO-CTERM domain-containing protein